MTDRKPALKRWKFFLHHANPKWTQVESNEGPLIKASDIPPAILNATKEELAALAVFAEAMPELLRGWELDSPDPRPLVRALNAALAAAKGVEG